MVFGFASISRFTQFIASMEKFLPSGHCCSYRVCKDDDVLSLSGRGPPIENTVLHNMEMRGVRLTVGIAGSFGILHYAVLAFTATRPTADRQPNVEQWPLLTEDLLGRGFRPARNADIEDIVLTAQPADDSIQCRASAEGLVSLLVDNSLVWSRVFNPEDPETALWLKAARTNGVTIISGDHLRSAEIGVDCAATMESLAMAKVPTAWTR